MPKRPRPEDFKAAMRFQAPSTFEHLSLMSEADSEGMARARELARRYLQYEFDFMFGDERKLWKS